MKHEIEDRLIRFSVANYELTGKLGKNEFSANLSNQLIRSSTSAALNYGEAQGAESMKDFVHKISLVIKELRESRVNLKIILESGICKDIGMLDALLNENEELIAIFFSTLKTAKRKVVASGE